MTEQWRTYKLDNNVEDDDKSVLVVLNLFLPIDLEGTLKEQRLQGVYADKDKGEHEVVQQTAEEVAREDTLVEGDLTATHLHFIIEL